jgi:hypothetical protein
VLHVALALHPPFFSRRGELIRNGCGLRRRRAEPNGAVRAACLRGRSGRRGTRPSRSRACRRGRRTCRSGRRRASCSRARGSRCARGTSGEPLLSCFPSIQNSPAGLPVCYGFVRLGTAAMWPLTTARCLQRWRAVGAVSDEVGVGCVVQILAHIATEDCVVKPTRAPRSA